MAKCGKLYCNWKTIFYGNYRSVINHRGVIGQAKQSNSVKKTRNKGYYAVQSYSISLKVIEIGDNRKPVCDFLLVTDILSRTVSELLQLIVHILDTLHFWAHVWELDRGNVRCTSWAHWEARIVNFLLVLIELFSLRVTAEALRAKIDRKSAYESGWVGMRQILRRTGTSPTNHFCTDS